MRAGQEANREKKMQAIEDEEASINESLVHALVFAEAVKLTHTSGIQKEAIEAKVKKMSEHAPYQHMHYFYEQCQKQSPRLLYEAYKNGTLTAPRVP